LTHIFWTLGYIQCRQVSKKGTESARCPCRPVVRIPEGACPCSLPGVVAMTPALSGRPELCHTQSDRKRSIPVAGRAPAHPLDTGPGQTGCRKKAHNPPGGEPLPKVRSGRLRGRAVSCARGVAARQGLPADPAPTLSRGPGLLPHSKRPNGSTRPATRVQFRVFWTLFPGQTRISIPRKEGKSTDALTDSVESGERDEISISDPGSVPFRSLRRRHDRDGWTPEVAVMAWVSALIYRPGETLPFGDSLHYPEKCPEKREGPRAASVTGSFSSC
jgi:hypothetical protein